MPGTWAFFNRAKQNLGIGGFNFSTAGAWKLGLHISSGATVLSNGHDFSTVVSISTVTGRLAQANGYGRSGRTLSSNAWFASSEGYGFCSNGVCWSANGGNFADLKYAIIWQSAGAFGSGFPALFATLTTTGLITVTDGSALKINGGTGSNAKIFSLA